METYVHSMMNICCDMRKDILLETMDVLKTKNLLTDDISQVFAEMVSTLGTNKRRVPKREKRPRFTGYHLFMREHRVLAKKAHPDESSQGLTTIVSRAWKHVPEEEKRVLRERALKMKQAYHSKTPAVENGPEPVKVEEPKKRAKETKPKEKRSVVRVSDCIAFLKERFAGVKRSHLRAAAGHMLVFIKEHELSSAVDEGALTYAIHKVNQEENESIFKVEESEESEESDESEDEKEEDNRELEDITDLASASDSSDEEE